MVTVSALLGAIAMILAATVVNVAVPSIMGAFGVGQVIAQWASTAFITTMVASQLISTWIVNALGARHTYVMTIAVFAVGGVISGIAPNIDTLIAGRIIQGFAAGVIQPLVLSTIVSVFPADKRAFAVSMYSMGVTLAPSFGPIVGGITLDALTWRHIFLVPLPMAFVAFLLGLSFIPQERKRGPLPPFDWVGLSLVCTFCVCIMTGLANGQRWGWHSNDVVALLVGGLLAGTVFLYQQSRSTSPILDIALFKNPAFSSAMVIAFLFGAGNFSTNYAIPVFTQTIQGFTATAAGSVLVPAGILLFVMTPISGRISDRVPAHYPLLIGTMAFALATYLMSKGDVNTAFVSIVLYTMLSRFALGLVMTNMGAVAMRGADDNQLNSAAATYNFVRQLGGAFGTLLFVVITEQRTAFHADAMAATQTSANPLSREFIGKVGRVLSESGVPETQQTAGALDFLSKVVHAQANTLGFQDGFLSISLTFVLAMIPAWMLRNATKRRI